MVFAIRHRYRSSKIKRKFTVKRSAQKLLIKNKTEGIRQQSSEEFILPRTVFLPSQEIFVSAARILPT